MRKNRRLAWLPLSAVILGLGLLMAGCQHSSSADFASKSKAQQTDALRGSINQLTPARRQEIAAHAQAMMDAHSRPGGQTGQTGQGGAALGGR